MPNYAIKPPGAIPGAGAPEIDLVYQHKIWEIMVELGTHNNTPREVCNRLNEWAQSQIELQSKFPGMFKTQIWNKPPSYRTVVRYSKKFRNHPPISATLSQGFRYPDAMEHVGWEYNRVSLECLRYYSEHFGIRPPVGLVKWFCRMAEARESNLSNSNTREAETRQIGIFAEIYWGCDLLVGLGQPIPDLTALELRLAWKSWDLGADHAGYKKDSAKKNIDPDDPIIDYSNPQWVLMLSMPSFMQGRVTIDRT